MGLPHSFERPMGWICGAGRSEAGADTGANLGASLGVNLGATAGVGAGTGAGVALVETSGGTPEAADQVVWIMGANRFIKGG